MRYLSLAILGKRIRYLRKFLFDSAVPKRKKLLVIFGIIYLLAPIDLVPEVVLGFGFIDDIVLWLFILNYLAGELDSYWREAENGPREEAAVNARKAFKGKVIINSTGSQVDEDSDD